MQAPANFDVDLDQTRAYVRSVAFKYVRDEQDAEDVTQDAMLLAHRYRRFDKRRAVPLAALQRLHAGSKHRGAKDTRANLLVQLDKKRGYPLVTPVRLEGEGRAFDVIGLLASLALAQAVESSGQLARSYIGHELLREIEDLAGCRGAGEVERFGE